MKRTKLMIVFVCLTAIASVFVAWRQFYPANIAANEGNTSFTPQVSAAEVRQPDSDSKHSGTSPGTPLAEKPATSTPLPPVKKTESAKPPLPAQRVFRFGGWNADMKPTLVTPMPQPQHYQERDQWLAAVMAWYVTFKPATGEPKRDDFSSQEKFNEAYITWLTNPPAHSWIPKRENFASEDAWIEVVMLRGDAKWNEAKKAPPVLPKDSTSSPWQPADHNPLLHDWRPLREEFWDESEWQKADTAWTLRRRPPGSPIQPAPTQYRLTEEWKSGKKKITRTPIATIAIPAANGPVSVTDDQLRQNDARLLRKIKDLQKQIQERDKLPRK